MPEVVGQYLLTTVLGGGGMATVYRGEHVSGIGMTAAVKKLHPHLAIDERIKQRLRIEAQALVRLQHPNIVRIIDFVESKDVCALVTELVEGRTLRVVMEEGSRPMPLTQAVMLLRQMLHAVGHAHKQQCLHRDIKPGNVMVTPDGQVKVLDFGIAALLDRDRMTGTGISLGTPVYMAPEQIDGTELLDERADIYALGVTFWEMLAGPNARPIGASGWRLREQHLRRLRDAGVPGSIVELVQAMVEEDRERRIRTCAEAVQALGWAMEEAHETTAPASPVEDTVDEDSDERTIPMTRPPSMDVLSPGMGLARSVPALNLVRPISTQSITADSVAHLVDGTERTVPMDRPTVTGQSTEATAPFSRQPILIAEQALSSLELDPSEHDSWPSGDLEPARDPETLHPVRPSASPPDLSIASLQQGRGGVVALAAGAGLLVLGGVALLVVLGAPGRGTRGTDGDLATLTALPGMVAFARGEFPYGADASPTGLSAFALQVREVTVADYRLCVAAKGCTSEALDRYGLGGATGTTARAPDPLEWVTWSEAQTYCAWRFADGVRPEGFAGRLPTDAEWERAARGTEGVGRTYPLGKVIPADLGNVGQVAPAAAGSTVADRTQDGIFDLTGGVEEWVWDGRSGPALEEHVDDHPTAASRSDPVMRPDKPPAVRALRGGHYGMNPTIDNRPFRTHVRAWGGPNQGAIQRGFRCAVGVEVVQ